LAERDRVEKEGRGGGRSVAALEHHVRTGVRRRVEGGPVRDAVLRVWDEVRAARVARRSARALRGLRSGDGLRVHLGCGADVRAGWVNVDFSHGIFTPPVPNAEGTVLVSHDLRRGLPLVEGSAAYVYSSHFFEHLGLADGTRLMRDCLRALRPGGTFRVSVPDFRACAEAYVRRDAAFFDLVDVRTLVPGLEPGTETLVDQMNYLVYQHGEHHCMYDAEKLVALLAHVGFASARESGFDPAVDPDTPARRRYSLFVEATR
jgi:predicted SAM-dependent methyltransferase